MEKELKEREVKERIFTHRAFLNIKERKGNHVVDLGYVPVEFVIKDKEAEKS